MFVFWTSFSLNDWLIDWYIHVLPARHKMLGVDDGPVSLNIFLIKSAGSIDSLGNMFCECL